MITGIINEEWRSISEYGNYQVSNIGRVKNVETHRILKPSIIKNGYCQIGLYKEKTKSVLYVHRLVAQEFIENPDDKHCVDHINHDKTNNTILNLRWASKSENAMNMVKSHNTSSKYKGVWFHKQRKNWNAQIMLDGKRKYIGAFTTEKKAAGKYNEAAIELFGRRALINEISSDEEQEEEKEEEETDDTTA